MKHVEDFVPDLGDFLHASAYVDEAHELDAGFWVPSFANAFSASQDRLLESPLGLDARSLYSVDTAIEDLHLPALDRAGSSPVDSEVATPAGIAPEHLTLCASGDLERTPSVSPEFAFPELAFDDVRADYPDLDDSADYAEAPLPARKTAAKKRAYNGTRNTAIPTIAMNAPTMPKSYLLPSATSRKRALSDKTAPAAKKQARVDYESVLDPDAVPDELVGAIELKRRMNCIAARRSRNRKKEHLDELQGEIETLKAEVAMWKQKCAALQLHGPIKAEE